MHIIDFVIKEIFRRKRKSIAGILLVVLGISIFVTCQTINEALYRETREELLRFGANIIVQPEGVPFDLHSGTVKGEVLLPEAYADKIRTIKHGKMLVAVSPKLYERFEVNGKSLLVVGITSEERQAKSWWMIENKVLTDEFPDGNEVLLGHYAATYLEEETSQIKLGGKTFNVSGVLDETGSYDDFMAFVPLDVLQELIQKWGMVNLIEITTSCIGCESGNIYDVAKDINEVLPPDAEVVIVRQIAEAQMGTLKKISDFTTIIYLVVLGLSAFLLVNYMSSSVDERRREIGMLLAMGMDTRKIQFIFVLKALFFAGTGGLIGYTTGTGISILLGPLIAEAKVSPVTYLLPISFVISVGLGVISSVIPARRVSRLDPVEALKEM
jgi:putative ABC transport system permease protein